ncbi:MAG TPA: hypothetical protein VMD75_06980, partial [Candidatus Binataceae bacterium]|nr:hypothetical protein [Candidatus Binataceae bacterium]
DEDHPGIFVQMVAEHQAALALRLVVGDFNLHRGTLAAIGCENRNSPRRRRWGASPPRRRQYDEQTGGREDR